MKYFPPLLFVFVSACVSAQSNFKTSIFNHTISLDTHCNLEISHHGKNTTHNLGFSKPGDCRLVTHANTNIVSTHFINGAYVLIAENNHDGKERCHSEYTGFGIKRDGRILTTPLVKKSRSCFQGKELKAFKYFSSKLSTAQ